jgi:hypothetical protein
MCPGANPVNLLPSTITTLTCGSLTVDVDTGTVVVVLSDGAEVEVSAVASVFIDDDGGSPIVEVLVGTATVRVGDITFVLGAGDVIENPGDTNIDHDNDGLPSAEEGVTGTNPLDPDDDGDGLLDGIDTTWLDDYTAGLPSDVFSHEMSGDARIRLRIDRIQKSIDKGDRYSALDKLASLRLKADGCGSSPDPNDWIVDCATQHEFLYLVGLLERNVAVMELPESQLL